MRLKESNSLFGIQTFGRDHNLFWRYDDNLAVFPDGDWVAEPFVHPESVMHSVLQDSLDIFAVIHKQSFG